MTLDPDAPAPYLAGHLEDALARDPRVSEQGLSVAIVAGRVHVTGTVSTGERRDQIPVVIAELLPGAVVCNEAVVTDYPEATEVEHLS